MKLLFVNGSRGEWGYIRPIIRRCETIGIDYSICATNMLLLPSHGSLVDEIRRDGFHVDDEIYMALEGSNHYSMAKSLGIFLTSFVDVLSRHKPTWIVLAGDRGEQLIGSIVGAYTYTPVAHIQAGERSGNIDGTSRHAIGKFAHLHFAANNDAEARLIKLGEEPFRVHNVGAPQLDELRDGVVSSREELFREFKIHDEAPFLLVVQHPVTEEMGSAAAQAEVLVRSLSAFETQKIWIMPNNDAGSTALRRVLLQNRRSDTQVFANLSRRNYLGLLKHCQAIVGNSSSGLLEAPTFSVPAVNLGRRQENRVQGINVINAEFSVEDCIAAIKLAISPEFRKKIFGESNPYGDGNSSQRIIDILRRTPIDDKLLIKRLVY